MDANEKNYMRDVLMSGASPSDELRKRFDKQIEALTLHPLTRRGKAQRVIQAVIFTIAGIGMAVGAISIAASHDPGLSNGNRLFMEITFGATSLFFFLTAYLGIDQLRRGVAAPRKQQKVMIFGTFAFMLTFVIATLMFAPTQTMRPEAVTLMCANMLVFWIMVWGFVLFYSMQWHREDVILEQKRTQLEVALLHEELAKRTSK